MILRISAAQSYDSLKVLELNSAINDLTIDEAAAMFYISTKTGVWRYDLEKDQQVELTINPADLPENRYYIREFSKTTETVKDPESYTQSVFSKNGEFLVYYRLEHQYEYIYVYKREKQTYQLHAIFNNRANVNSCGISEDLELAVGSGGGQIRLWNIKSKSFIRLMKPDISTGYVASIKYSELDNHKIVISNGASESIVLNTKTDSVYATWKYGFYPIPGTKGSVGQGVKELTFTENDSIVAISLTNRVFSSLNLWNLNTNQVSQVLTDTVLPFPIDKTRGAIITGTSDGMVYSFNISSQKMTPLLPSDQDCLVKLKLSESGKYLMTVDENGSLMIWLNNQPSTNPEPYEMAD